MRCKDVILIDDDPGLRDVFREVVSRRGYNVSTFANAKEALEDLRSREQLAGIVFLDLEMPVMDGFQFLQERRMDPRLGLLPVVILAAFPPADRLFADVVAVLEKPTDADAMLEMIRRFCGQPANTS